MNISSTVGRKITPSQKNMDRKDSKSILKAQLEVELGKLKQCSYEPYNCSHLAVDGSKFCLKHILNDKNAPYKQCNFTFQNNGKRCNLPAPKTDKKDYGYCNEHSLKSTLSRNKQNAKNPPPLSAESLLTTLTHYVKKPRNKSADKSASSSYISDDERGHRDDGAEPGTVRPIDPFVDIDASAVYSEQCNEVLDFCSESESDVEPSTYATVWHDGNADSSDNESIDSEDEDPLKHANVYTTEEISLLTRDRLVRLQSLYIEEYKYLRYLLKERRRKYIHSLKREKETCCNIYNQVRDNPKEQRLYRKLKQYNKYHKAYGEEAILEKRLHDLRAKISEGVQVKPPSYSKCLFTEGGVKCGERALPLAKHCRKHILEDPNQVLFKACGKVNADVECNTPIEAIFDDSTCKLHMDVPPIRCYNQPRKESESDPDDTLDLPPHYAMPTTRNVKTEMIDYSLPSLSKMETLPSILFEDSAESLSSTIQYSTSEFTESFAEQSSIDIPENSTNAEIIDQNSQKTDEVIGASANPSQNQLDETNEMLSFANECQQPIAEEAGENYAKQTSQEMNAEQISQEINVEQTSQEINVEQTSQEINVEQPSLEMSVENVVEEVALESTTLEEMALDETTLPEDGTGAEYSAVDASEKDTTVDGEVEVKMDVE